jgi:hypothetical protein
MAIQQEERRMNRKIVVGALMVALAVVIFSRRDFK